MRDSERPADSTESLADDTGASGIGSGPPRGGRPPSRWRTLIATVAAVLIVALLGAVFATLAHNHGRLGVAGNGPTRQPQTPAPPSTPALPPIHMLSEQPSVTNQPGIPVVGQNNPQIMYEYADNGPGPVLRRSDDGGKSWHDLAFPTSANNLGALYLAVSPLDAENVILEMDVNIPAGGVCQVHADARNTDIPTSGGGVLCPQMFHSEDGGTIWRPVSLPISGSIFGNGVVFYYNSMVVQGQGNRLYVRVYDKLNITNPQLDIRILSTTDNGASWQIADASLVKQAPHVCEYAATPAGSTLFAVSAASCIGTSGGTLWRSDDAGANWTRVGPAPAWVLISGPPLVATNFGGDPNRPLLYAEQMPSPVTAASDISVSTDGGKTWQNAPLAGVPAKAQPLMMGSAALPDGSIVTAFSGAAPSGVQGGLGVPTATPSLYGSQGDVSCYYWSPGASAWKPLTPAIPMVPSNLSNVFVSNTSAGITVTLSIGDISTSSPLYTIQPFA